MDVKTMKAELNGIMDVFQKPFAAKGLMFNYNIPFLNSIFEKVLFVQMKRDPVTNIASVLEARIRQLGSENDWYSFKIPEYDLLKDFDPITQCAGQVLAINRAVSAGLEDVSENRKLVVQYEEFCEAPHIIFKKLLKKLGAEENKIYKGPLKFTISRKGNIARKADIIKSLKLFDSESL